MEGRGGAGRGDGAGVVRAGAKSRGERVAVSQEHKGITWIFTDRVAQSINDKETIQ